MPTNQFILDAHLDLSMNALEWNRDLTRPIDEIRVREKGQTDKKDRGASPHGSPRGDPEGPGPASRGEPSPRRRLALVSSAFWVSTRRSQSLTRSWSPSRASRRPSLARICAASASPKTQSASRMTSTMRASLPAQASVDSDRSASSSVVNTAGVTYAYAFSLSETTTIDTVTMTVPAGTAGTPIVGTVTPTAIAGGTVSLSGTTLTYTLPSAQSVSST